MNRPRSCRVVLLVLVACLAHAAMAAAQTVTVIGLPSGGSLTVLVNNNTVGMASADAMGIATVKFMAVQGRDMDIRLYRESCSGMVRVLLQSAATPLPPPTGCPRQDSGWTFAMRPVTTFVIDAEAAASNVRISQGPAPASWLVRGTTTEKVRERDWEPPVGAVVLSGGGGLVNLTALSDPQCGDVSTCSRDHFRPAFSAGAMYWLTRAIGIQGSASRATEVKAHGSGAGFTFDSAARLDRLNLAAVAGIVPGIVRIYGIGGVTYSRTVTTASESIDASADAVAAIHRTTLETRGWGGLFGGGIEVWATRRLAVFGEITGAMLRGDDVKGGQAEVDGTVGGFAAGMRFSLGR